MLRTTKIENFHSNTEKILTIAFIILNITINRDLDLTEMHSQETLPFESNICG